MRRLSLHYTATFVLLVATFLPVAAQTMRQVTTTGNTSADGSSWTSAMTLQAALMASTTAVDKDEIQVTIKYKTPSEFHGSYLYIRDDASIMDKVDSTLIETDNSAIFQINAGTLPEGLYTLLIGSNPLPFSEFIIGKVNTEVKVSIEADENFNDAPLVFVKGGTTKDQLALLKFRESTNPVIYELIKIVSALRAGGREAMQKNPEAYQKMAQRRFELSKKFEKLTEEYINTHRDELALYFISGLYIKSYNSQQLDSILSLYDISYQKSRFYKKVQGAIVRMNSLAKGNMAPGFTKPDVDGNMVSLSSYKGKYLLLDFWASWCGPCRMENPMLVKIYQSYKDKGFEILGVSYDNEREKWLKAIEQDQLSWKQVSDLKGWKDETVEMYQINDIPNPYLLDPEGRIVAKGEELRGEKLKKVLSSIFED